MIKAETLASISEYDEDSGVASAIGSSGPHSTYGSGYMSRSQSGDSLNTLTTTTTKSYKNGERQKLSENPTKQRIRGKASMDQKKNYDLCKKVRVTLALIGILFLVAAIFMLSFYLPKQYNQKSSTQLVVEPKKKDLIWDDNLNIKDDMQIQFSTNFSGPKFESEWRPNIALKGYFGEHISQEKRRHAIKHITNNSISFTFNDSSSTLEFSKVDFSDQCYRVHWSAEYHVLLQDCFDTESSYWYGLGEMISQIWPISKGSFPMTKFTTNDFLMYPNEIFGGVLEPLAINSNGAGIYVPDTVSLYVSMNEKKKKEAQKKFCIRAVGKRCDIDDLNNAERNELNYTICIADNIREVHRILFEQYIQKPTKLPNQDMILKPIWCTWVKFKQEVNQSRVLKFAENILKYKFDASHLIIDDKYSTNYGELNFDPKKFSDVSNMINRLRSDGFKTVVSITPYTNLDAKTFLPEYSRWIKVGSGKKKEAGIVNWWNGRGVVLDTTSKDAIKWFKDKLVEFQKLKLDGFKFDGGEVNSLPPHYIFEEPQVNPSYYSNFYVELASHFPLSEVRVGYKSQRYSVFVRLLDRYSDWSQQNGLRSVLNGVLTFSILGYSYIIPDMVAGNDYVKRPNKELYVRWAQLCAFLPSIQFSIAPWDFDTEVVEIVQEALAIRKNLSNYILDLANNVTVTGEPLIRPLWWHWPKDTESYVIDYEFMLGGTYLIAPILNVNIVTHAIYLPPGIWEEQWGAQRQTINTTEGGIFHYPVDLHTICYFKLVKHRQSLS